MKVNLSTKIHKIHNRIANNYNPCKSQPNIGLRQQYKYARNRSYYHESMTLVPALIAIYGAATNQIQTLLIGGAGGAVITKIASNYQKDAAAIRNLKAYKEISQRAARIFGKKI